MSTAAACDGLPFVLVPDVKPSNVLINTLGQVKMCDFGISGYLVDSVAKTIDAGCKPYMAVSTAASESADRARKCASDGRRGKWKRKKQSTVSFFLQRFLPEILSHLLHICYFFKNQVKRYIIWKKNM